MQNKESFYPKINRMKAEEEKTRDSGRSGQAVRRVAILSISTQQEPKLLLKQSVGVFKIKFKMPTYNETHYTIEVSTWSHKKYKLCLQSRGKNPFQVCLNLCTGQVSGKPCAKLRKPK